MHAWSSAFRGGWRGVVYCASRSAGFHDSSAFAWGLANAQWDLSGGSVYDATHHDQQTAGNHIAVGPPKTSTHAYRWNGLKGKFAKVVEHGTRSTGHTSQQGRRSHARPEGSCPVEVEVDVTLGNTSAASMHSPAFSSGNIGSPIGPVMGWHCPSIRMMVPERSGVTQIQVMGQHRGMASKAKKKAKKEAKKNKKKKNPDSGSSRGRGRGGRFPAWESRGYNGGSRGFRGRGRGMKRNRRDDDSDDDDRTLYEDEEGPPGGASWRGRGRRGGGRRGGYRGRDSWEDEEDFEDDYTERRGRGRWRGGGDSRDNGYGRGRGRGPTWGSRARGRGGRGSRPARAASDSSDDDFSDSEMFDREGARGQPRGRRGAPPPGPREKYHPRGRVPSRLSQPRQQTSAADQRSRAGEVKTAPAVGPKETAPAILSVEEFIAKVGKEIETSSGSDADKIGEGTAGGGEDNETAKISERGDIEPAGDGDGVELGAWGDYLEEKLGEGGGEEEDDEDGDDYEDQDDNDDDDDDDDSSFSKENIRKLKRRYREEEDADVDSWSADDDDDSDSDIDFDDGDDDDDDDDEDDADDEKNANKSTQQSSLKPRYAGGQENRSGKGSGQQRLTKKQQQQQTKGRYDDSEDDNGLSDIDDFDYDDEDEDDDTTKPQNKRSSPTSVKTGGSERKSWEKGDAPGGRREYGTWSLADYNDEWEDVPRSVFRTPRKKKEKVHDPPPFFDEWPSDGEIRAEAEKTYGITKLSGKIYVSRKGDTGALMFGVGAVPEGETSADCVPPQKRDGEERGEHEIVKVNRKEFKRMVQRGEVITGGPLKGPLKKSSVPLEANDWSGSAW